MPTTTKAKRPALVSVPAHEDDFLDIDDLLDDRKETTLILYNADRTRSHPIHLVYRPGAITSRMLAAFRNAGKDGESDRSDETCCEFLAEVLISWTIKDKRTGGQLGVSYDDVANVRFEIVVPVMQHIAGEMFGQTAVGDDGEEGPADPKPASARSSGRS